MKRLLSLVSALLLCGCQGLSPLNIAGSNPPLAGSPNSPSTTIKSQSHSAAHSSRPASASSSAPKAKPASQPPAAPATTGSGSTGGGSTGVSQQTSGSLSLNTGSQASNTWVAGPSLQEPRAGLNVIALGSVLMALEGSATPSIETLKAGGTWQVNDSYDVATPPDPLNPSTNVLIGGLWLLASASDGTYVYTLGGSQNSPVTNVGKYNATSGYVSSYGDLGTAVQAAAATYAQGTFYVAGGMNASGTVLAQVQTKQSSNNGTAAAMPTGVAGAASVTLNGKLYVFGGYTLDASKNPVPQSLVQVFDPTANTWRTSSDGQPGAPAPLPAARHSSAAALLNGKVYLTGGVGASGTLLNDLQIYDPTTNKWTAGAPMPTARALLGLGAFNGQIWAVGGFNADKMAQTTVEVYQP